MKKPFLTAFAFLIVLGASFALYASSRDSLADKNPGKARSDLVVIDDMSAFGDLERTPVLFPHDLHTKVLSSKGKDCTTCHQKSTDEKAKGLVYLFKRAENTDPDTVRDAYHLNCIRCHEETLASGEKSGPVTCNACHTKKAIYTSNRIPMGFDNSLHYRHSKAVGNKCEKCHHEYDKKTEKLFYAKGREGSCRYCHGDVRVENRSPMKEASHRACITCHQEIAATKKDAGPADCGGCHDPIQRAKIARIKDIPRYERGQPDAELLTPSKTEENIRMMPALFDHKSHEYANDTCRICHHAAIESCAKCHDETGEEKGGNISLVKAMHAGNSKRSCVGCHDSRKAESACAGCHSSMDAGWTMKEGEGCLACHYGKLPPGIKLAALTDKERQAIASEMLTRGRPVKPTFTVSPDDVVETVTIDALADKYKPSKLPHRKMYKFILQGVSDSKLAGFFHGGESTLCRGCHHNSPAGIKPPKCESCHSKNEKVKTAENIIMPSLRGAYHQQCIGCHQAMGIEKVGCTDCHEKK